MARREEKGLSLDPPDDWVDRSVITYAAPPRAGETTSPSLVVTRDDLKDSETLQTYTDRHLLGLSGELPDFELVDSGKRTMGEGNYPAIFLRFHWRTPYGLIEQGAIFVETAGAAGREVRGFTTTVLAEKAEAERPRLEEILKTVRLTPASGPPSGGTPSRRPQDPAPFDLPMPGSRSERKR